MPIKVDFYLLALGFGPFRKNEFQIISDDFFAIAKDPIDQKEYNIGKSIEQSIRQYRDKPKQGIGQNED